MAHPHRLLLPASGRHGHHQQRGGHHGSRRAGRSAVLAGQLHAVLHDPGFVHDGGASRGGEAVAEGEHARAGERRHGGGRAGVRVHGAVQRGVAVVRGGGGAGRGGRVRVPAAGTRHDRQLVQEEGGPCDGHRHGLLGHRRGGVRWRSRACSWLRDSCRSRARFCS